MKLYGAVSTKTARAVIDHGFTGRPEVLETDGKPDEIIHVVEFRDIPPGGLTLSRTTETTVEADGDEVRMSMTGGPVLLDYLGDFVLEIDVPDAVALSHEVFEDSPMGWPFREFWLSPEEANQYRDTLKVFSSDDGEEVRPDLVGK